MARLRNLWNRLRRRRVGERVDLKLAQYKTAYISFSAEINPTTTEQLIATATNLVGQGHNQLYFLFSSPGGNVMNGVNIYNVLRGLPAKLIFHNVYSSR